MTNNAISHTLGGQHFQSKAAIKRYVQALLKATPQNSYLQKPDLGIVCDLLKLHPQASDKIGCGVTAIQVVNHHPGLPGVGFWVHRCDGTATDFSYKACLEPHHGNNRASAIEAFRVAIVPQVAAVKEAMLKDAAFAPDTFWSEVEGCEISNDKAALDHYPVSFASILARFLSAHCLTVEQVETVKLGLRHELADPALLKLWRDFHECRAKYRLISADLNSRLGDHQKAVV